MSYHFSAVLISIVIWSTTATVVCSIVHFSSASGSVMIIIYGNYVFSDVPEILAKLAAARVSLLVFICCVYNVLFGVIVIPSKHLAPSIFAPVVCVIFGCLRIIVDNCVPGNTSLDL